MRDSRSHLLRHGLLLLTLQTLLPGCAALRVYNAEAPTVRVADINLVSFSFAEQSLDVTLQVSNPNAYALPIDGIDYELRVDDESLAGGATDGGFTLPANGTESVQVSVGGNLLDSLEKYQRWQAEGRDAIDYVLSGSLRVAGVPVSLPFSYRDSFSLTAP